MEVFAFIQFILTKKLKWEKKINIKSIKNIFRKIIIDLTRLLIFLLIHIKKWNMKALY